MAETCERKSTERNTAGRKSPERKSPERRISSRSSEKKLSRKSPERRKSSRSPEQSQRLAASSSRGRVSKTSKSLPDKGPMSPPTKLPSSKTRRSTADMISASSAKAARKTSPELRKTYPPVTGMQETSRTKPTGSLVPIYQQQALNSCHSNSRHSNSRHSNSGQAEQPLEPSPAGELLTRLYGNSRLLRDRGDEEETPSSANLTYSFNTAEGIKVFVYQCDLTRLATDVIVNPANENLHHIGGVARAISDAAGPRLQMECTQYVTKNGPLKVSEVMCTPACGRLLCAYVVHTVGPVWALYTSPARCAAVLRQTVTNCLHYAANKLRAKSVAFPAISTGVYGVPLDVCARSMFEAIHAYSAATPRVTTVKHVHVVVNDAEGAGVMSAVFQQLRDAGYQECGYDSDVSSNADEIARSKSEKKTSKEKSSSKGSRKQKPKSATETNLNRVGDVGEFFEDNHRQAQGQDKVTIEQVEEALQKISLETMTSTQSTRSSVEGVKSPNERLPAQQDITSPRHDAVSPKHAMMSPREESKSFTERRSSSQDAISPRQQDMTSPREENKSSRSSSRRSSRQDPISQRDIAASPKEESVFLQEKAAQDITSPRQVKASPRQATTSVLDDVHSPQDSFHSPRQEVMSQREYFTSPRSSEANKDGVSSPKYPILSPREQIMSSQSPKQLASPKGEVNSPRDDFLSSQNMTSPKQNTISSNDEFKSPRSFRQSARSPTTQDITSPREEFKSPRTYTLSPRDDAAMTNQVTSPRGSITSPRQQITSPRYPIRSPKQPLTSPRGEQITSPREQQQVPSPQYPIMSPRQQITSPRERVASLTDDLKSPRQRLSSHESTTASTQPENGNMEAEVDRRIVLPGYQESPGAIVVSYTFPYGVQESHHPHPGEAYNGTTVVTFLPNTQDGRHALQLLQKAFNLGKLFTIDKWSQIVMAIHQKTKVEGGLERNGYPDPDYIQTLLEQLAALGIAADTQKQPSRTPSVDENMY